MPEIFRTMSSTDMWQWVAITALFVLVMLLAPNK